MKRCLAGLLLLSVISMLVTSAIVADEGSDTKEKKKAEAVCPVADKAIDKSISVEYGGGKVFFCCKGCVSKFKADTAKYATGANRQLVITEQVEQTGCPLADKKCNPKQTLEVSGVAVAFCCGGCKAKVAKAEAKDQIEMVFGAKAFEKAYKLKKEKSGKKS